MSAVTLLEESLLDAPATPYRGASRRAIEHHYDVGNEFWSLWLDPTMTYSCALWGEGDTLEAAQLRKLDFHIDNAHAAGAPRVLDVGCGWGSMLARLLQRGAGHVTGLTLSREQHEWISAWQERRIEVHATGWEQYDAEERYNAIISMGAFEHFARPGMTPAQKLAGYARFFGRCHELLLPGGWMSLQTIAKGETALDLRGLSDFSFIMRKVFPESDLPELAVLVQALERRFEVVALHNDRWDYVRTCEAWLMRLRAARANGVGSCGEELFDRYERYLVACVRQFAAGHAVLLRLALRRVERGRGLRLGGGAGGR